MAQSNKIQWTWLFDDKSDRYFLILSPLITFVFLGLYFFLEKGIGLSTEQSVVISYLVFGCLFDFPHIIQTFSRTHMDPSERKRSGSKLTLYLVLIIGVTLSCVYSGHKKFFNLGFELIGFYHIYRQNIGFIRLYLRKQKGDMFNRRWLYEGVYSFCVLCCLAYSLGYLGEAVFWSKEIQIYVLKALHGAFLGAVIFYIGFHFRLCCQNKPIGASVASFSLMTLLSNYVAFIVVGNPVMSTLYETAYHDVQYQGWMRNYQKRVLKWSKLRIKVWFMITLACGLAYFHEFVFQDEKINFLIEYLILSIILFHYVVDGIIWRTKKSPELSVMLS